MSADVETDTVEAALLRRQARLKAAREERKAKRGWKQIRRRRVRAWRTDREDPKYLAWIRTLPCAVCGRSSEAHHEPRKGLGGGGDWHDRKTIPLCPDCHTMGPQARHHFGKLSHWERAVGISAEAWISRLNAAYALQHPDRSRTSGQPSSRAEA